MRPEKKFPKNNISTLIANRGSKKSSYKTELQNRITCCDVILRVSNLDQFKA